MLRCDAGSVYRFGMDGDRALETALAPMTAAPRHQRARGRARTAFRQDQAAGVTRLSDLYQSHPMRVLFPRPAKGDPITAVLATVSGGIAGGDRIEIEIDGGEGTESLVLAQAAEKIYRAPDPDPARIAFHLQAGPGAGVEYLPQETILFDGARLHRETVVDIAAADGRVLTGEIAVFGRGAMGETVRDCAFRETWRVRIAGRTVWRDAFALTPDARESRFGLNGAAAMGTIVCAAGDLATLRDALRPHLPQSDAVTAAVGRVGPLLLARFLGRDPAALRKAYYDTWSRLRQAALHRPARLPALIHC